MTSEAQLLQSLTEPLFFNTRAVSQALDNFDETDPHRNAYEFDDPHITEAANNPLYDTSKSTPIHMSNSSLGDLPDISDAVMSDYKIQKMLGRDVEPPVFVDLDTAPDYVGFIKNSIRTQIASENEFGAPTPAVYDKQGVKISRTYKLP
tara:strand:+ start:4261 stop:4707 length:447 start_codon:yes stop_codon:yes gene_type:complete